MSRPSSASGVTRPWLIAMALWFLAVGAFTWLNLRNGTHYTICLLKNLTDIPCPGCGGTRATLALAKGHFAEAFSFNPLTTSILLLSPFLLFAYGWNHKRDPSERWRPGRVFWTIATTIVLTNWWFVMKNLP